MSPNFFCKFALRRRNLSCGYGKEYTLRSWVQFSRYCLINVVWTKAPHTVVTNGHSLGFFNSCLFLRKSQPWIVKRRHSFTLIIYTLTPIHILSKISRTTTKIEVGVSKKGCKYTSSGVNQSVVI